MTSKYSEFKLDTVAEEKRLQLNTLVKKRRSRSWIDSVRKFGSSCEDFTNVFNLVQVFLSKCVSKSCSCIVMLIWVDFVLEWTPEISSKARSIVFKE